MREVQPCAQFTSARDVVRLAPGLAPDPPKSPALHNSQQQRKLLKAVREFGTYITSNRTFIVNYGDRYRHGEIISTGFVESAINQVVSKRMVKKQQMRWTERGALLLLQVRTRVLNQEWRSTLSRWYPWMQETCDAKAA